MKRKSTILICIMMISLAFIGCSTQKPVRTELVISTAASLSNALNEIKMIYEVANPDVVLQLNIGASGALQRQIEQGAPVDVFISASMEHMDALVLQGLIEREHRQILLANELVVIVPAEHETISTLSELTSADINKIAIGIPESVPAGSYAVQALKAAKLWDKVQDKTVQAKDVRQVLQYVETSNADAGFVYLSDALSSEKVKLAMNVKLEDAMSIDYPVGIIKATRQPVEAESFFTYLKGPEASNIFEKYGFLVAGRLQQ